LKSTRMRTRLPLRSRSVIASLLERDMVVGSKALLFASYHHGKHL
jgi:hypothetical protein